jgi:hypothetical protein
MGTTLIPVIMSKQNLCFLIHLEASEFSATIYNAYGTDQTDVENSVEYEEGDEPENNSDKEETH